MSKRKLGELTRPGHQLLTEHEKILYDLIRSKQDMGIWSADMKRETGLPQSIFSKSLKSLQVKQKIKEVVNVQHKGKKHYMAMEFTPSPAITGGAWYSDGNLDTEFIEELKRLCLMIIQRLKVATVDMVMDAVNKSGSLKEDLSDSQIKEILTALVLENSIVEVKSTGSGEFASIKASTVCYKCTKQAAKEPKIGAFASIPCGVCPRIKYCTPDGIISPSTCVYYTKWLEF